MLIGRHAPIVNQRYNVITRATLVLAALVSGCASSPVTAEQSQTADISRGSQPAWSSTLAKASGSLDPNIPTPESIIGHAIGDGAVHYEPMVRYLHALAGASPLVTLTPYAQSHEDRTLYYVTITSEANHVALSKIKADNAKLADPRTLDGRQEAERILDYLPGIGWLAYCIHGDELSSTDAALQVAYQLVAGTDKATRRLREELVIHIDPLMNPDGRERYQGQIRHLTGKVSNPDYQAMQHWGLWSRGRGNHYLFDLNRDWLMQVHPETRGRAAKILEWNPHLVVDSHEMGSLDTYLFDPPREPFNLNLSEANLQWRRRFSADQAKAFDRHGWSYYTQEWYEEWYPGYTNAWTSLLGAIGILYEQAGVQAAEIKQATGKILTYRESVHHHVVSSLANLESLRANRRAILKDYLADQQWAVSEAQSGSEVFLLPPPADRRLFERFRDLLSRHGLEVGVAANPFTANDVVDIWGNKTDMQALPAGTLVVRAAQPRRRLLQAILEFDPHMSDRFLHEERKDLENHRGTRVYDVSAWNLCMAYGLTAYWAGGVPELTLGEGTARDNAHPEKKPAYGFLIDGASSDIYPAMVRLLEKKCKVRVANKAFTISGHEYAPGAVLLRNHENPGELRQLLEGLTGDLDLDIRAVDTALCEAGPDLGGNRFRLLVEPRIAIASQWPISSTSFGSAWYLLDARTGLRTSPVNLQAIGWIDLRKYNVILLPHSWGPEGMRGILNEGARNKLRNWIKAGGTLIALGNSAAFAAGKDHGLSSVRLRRDVLDKLSVYEEALKREQSARDIKVEPAAVWGTIENAPGDDSAESPKEDDKTAAKPKAKPDLETLKRQDAWLRMFRPSGAIAAASLDPEHWLCFGVAGNRTNGEKLPVLLSGQSVFMSKHPVKTPVRLAAKDNLRLSGLLWPEARDRLANSAYATVERVGYGQIILFAGDPFFRAYLEGTGRLFLNALLLGPGLGTSQPVPW
ncbi:MAG: hypothetical protein JSU86_20805 [Phycisphaerales bacterium]|nr:MAG: hypothetical protein JSU86_20805 [Phycisphaerales bacterium]